MYDLIIIGAGPIGLMLANLLSDSKLKILIVEKKEKPDQNSKAIGITPPSLNLLKKLNLVDVFIDNGVRVNSVIVHGTKKVLGTVTFNSIKSDYKFILSIPQVITEILLENNLGKFDNITLLREYEVNDINISNDGVEVGIKDYKNITSHFKAEFVCACDGGKSTIREVLKIPFKGAKYHDTFLMADFKDQTDFGDDAHLFFTKKGPIESFPLPAGKRRWIVDTPKYLKDPPLNFLENRVLDRAGVDLKDSVKLSQNPFGVQHYINTEYYHKRVIFCGDSAHIMSPIGGQGMNTGFADAEFAAAVIKKLILKTNKKNYFELYKKYRQKAAKTAIKRAWLSMRIGTMKGAVLSAIRNFMVIYLLKFFKKMVPMYFSMLTIPYGTFEKVKKKNRSLFE